MDFVGLCKQKFNDDLEIVSGGCADGADRYAKECALSLGVKYVEFPPYFRQWNAYCPKPAYLYGKQYHVKYFFMRNKEIVEYADKVIAFIPMGHISNGTNNTLMWAKKLDKPSTVIN
jgi:predicted Rossmann-fold nucleotide-binding protein